MKKKRRYSFWIVLVWVAAFNVVLGGLSLLMLFYVKFPYQTFNAAAFDRVRWIMRLLSGIAVQTGIFYLGLNWFYGRLIRRADWRSYVMPVLALVGICFVFYTIVDMTVEREELKVAVDISVKIYTYGFSALFQIGLPLLIAFVTRHLDEKKWQAENQKTLEQRTFQLEREKMQADYLFLKAQINPHFLHNTLNFLYSRALPHSPELSEGILTLSEIMRYALDKTEDGDGKVPLSREIEHLQHIIRIHQLRFAGNLQVSFVMQGDPAGHRILPFVLITLAENAFKHGDLNSPACPVALELSISSGGQLHFHTANRKKSGPKELSTGIGLDNTRKRLELAYGENYSLYIKDQRELFIVDLNITL